MVTGASGSLGRAISVRLAHDGCDEPPYTTTMPGSPMRPFTKLPLLA